MITTAKSADQGVSPGPLSITITREGKLRIYAGDNPTFREVNRRFEAFEPGGLVDQMATALEAIRDRSRAWIEDRDPMMGDALTAARYEKMAKEGLAGYRCERSVQRGGKDHADQD